MYAKHIIRKFLKKILALIMFLVITILNILCTLFSKFILNIAAPVSFLGAVASLVYMLYTRDFDSTAVSIIVIAGIIFIMKLVLPHIGLHLNYAREILKYTMAQPIITKSPVKYTM